LEQLLDVLSAYVPLGQNFLQFLLLSLELKKKEPFTQLLQLEDVYIQLRQGDAHG
jgi:hypothetical protein